MMELLSPAGSREALIAAVQNGADAVYFGGSMFNARRFAAISQALKYAEFLCRTGADAAIVQDMGLVSLIRKNIPELPLHASTQMGIHELNGAREAEKLGLEQVVLSREVPLGEIEYIHNNTPIALEAFAHGALCMSFSGACLLSSMAGERSGNRGTCAQPCRKRMGLDYMPGRDEYDLSLGDLCMIEHLAELKQAGVSCIKLEGRMKRAEYVAVVTRAYRDALDGADKAEISRHKKRMLDMFDRGGGCTGYFYGDIPVLPPDQLLHFLSQQRHHRIQTLPLTGYFYGDNAHTGCIAVSDRSKELIEEAANSYAKDTRKQPVDMELYMRVGEAARLAMCLGGDNVEAVGDVVQPAQKPQTAERYMEQARKLGDTPFICAGIRADIDEKAFLPMSAVNALRRDASAKLLESLHWRRSCDSGDVPKLKNQPAEHTRITVIASTLDQAKAAFGAGADEVALEPWEFHIAAFEAAAAFKGSKKLLISLPVAIISHKEAEKIMKIIGSGLIDGGIAANVGQLELIRSLPLRIAGTQMNAMNGYTVQAYKDMGFDRVTLSLELTKPQLRDISGAGTAVSVYGRAQLMQLRHCPVKEYRGCRSCDGFTGKMVDEGGREFPLCNVRQEDGCLVRLLNCLPTDITDLYGELPEPEAVQLAFYDEAPEKVRERIAAAMAARDGRKVSPAKNATRGHWNRAVD